jgi:ubiquinone/menaquinone biosynthesis C-methylase UbiE
MSHEDEYHDAMVSAIELVWGDGFLAPGGEGNVANLVDGIDVRNKRVLDIGCGIGGPACTLANQHGAQVVGTDLERALLGRTQRRAADQGLAARVGLVQVEPGPLSFADDSFDVVLSSGAFTQTEDKLGMFRECHRILEPGGWISAYDWMKPEGDYSKEMLHWFEMEGLTYAMETPERHGELLREAGFGDVEIIDRSDWYRKESRAEYERIKPDHYKQMVELVGEQEADHFTENWRALTVVCERGEMLQVYCRGRKPE